MPEEQVVERAQRDKEEGKSASTQAGEFVREEMHHIREGKHGAQSPEQAIAIGLSKARRAGVALPDPKRGSLFEDTGASAARSRKRTARGKTQNIASALTCHYGRAQARRTLCGGAIELGKARTHHCAAARREGAAPVGGEGSSYQGKVGTAPCGAESRKDAR